MEKTLLDFAYKYPFSNEAKDLVQKNAHDINVKYLQMSAAHIEGALDKGFEYNEIKMESIKIDYVMSYLYSRMLLSALKRKDLIISYALAEAKRSANALLISENDEIINMADQLGLKIGKALSSRGMNSVEEFTISFVDYVNNIPKSQDFDLVNQKLSSGILLLDRNRIARVMEQAIAKEIAKDLPIKSSDLPKQVTDYAKTLRFRTILKSDTARQSKGNEQWIEKLLQTPIADVRHRTVNLILAPYLVNTKSLDVGAATKIIIDYIEKCKQIDPSTKINERYIEYQCDYAKRKGSRPLSLERAKELLGSQIDFEEQKTEQK